VRGPCSASGPICRSIFLCTGFSHQVTAELAARKGARRFLLKPVSIKELAEALRNVLDESAPGG
jgi:ActR/RegA family two-component response regulator